MTSINVEKTVARSSSIILFSSCSKMITDDSKRSTHTQSSITFNLKNNIFININRYKKSNGSQFNVAKRLKCPKEVKYEKGNTSKKVNNEIDKIQIETPEYNVCSTSTKMSNCKPPVTISSAKTGLLNDNMISYLAFVVLGQDENILFKLPAMIEICIDDTKTDIVAYQDKAVSCTEKTDYIMNGCTELSKNVLILLTDTKTKSRHRGNVDKANETEATLFIQIEAESLDDSDEKSDVTHTLFESTFKDPYNPCSSFCGTMSCLDQKQERQEFDHHRVLKGSNSVKNSEILHSTESTFIEIDKHAKPNFQLANTVQQILQNKTQTDENKTDFDSNIRSMYKTADCDPSHNIGNVNKETYSDVKLCSDCFNVCTAGPTITFSNKMKNNSYFIPDTITDAFQTKTLANHGNIFELAENITLKQDQVQTSDLKDEQNLFKKSVENSFNVQPFTVLCVTSRENVFPPLHENKVAIERRSETSGNDFLFERKQIQNCPTLSNHNLINSKVLDKHEQFANDFETISTLKENNKIPFKMEETLQVNNMKTSAVGYLPSSKLFKDYNLRNNCDVRTADLSHTIPLQINNGYLESKKGQLEYDVTNSKDLKSNEQPTNNMLENFSEISQYDALLRNLKRRPIKKSSLTRYYPANHIHSYLNKLSKEDYIRMIAESKIAEFKMSQELEEMKKELKKTTGYRENSDTNANPNQYFSANCSSNNEYGSNACYGFDGKNQVSDKNLVTNSHYTANFTPYRNNISNANSSVNAKYEPIKSDNHQKLLPECMSRPSNKSGNSSPTKTNSRTHVLTNEIKLKTSKSGFMFEDGSPTIHKMQKPSSPLKSSLFFGANATSPLQPLKVTFSSDKNCYQNEPKKGSTTNKAHRNKKSNSNMNQKNKGCNCDYLESLTADMWIEYLGEFQPSFCSQGQKLPWFMFDRVPPYGQHYNSSLISGSALTGSNRINQPKKRKIMKSTQRQYPKQYWGMSSSNLESTDKRSKRPSLSRRPSMFRRGSLSYGTYQACPVSVILNKAIKDRDISDLTGKSAVNEKRYSDEILQGTTTANFNSVLKNVKDKFKAVSKYKDTMCDFLSNVQMLNTSMNQLCGQIDLMECSISTLKESVQQKEPDPILDTFRNKLLEASVLLSETVNNLQITYEHFNNSQCDDCKLLYPTPSKRNI